jgi:hypothetical protein
MKGYLSNRDTESGFVLVLTLWAVVLVALVCMIIEGWVSASLDRAHDFMDRVAAGSAVVSATNEAAFVLCTNALGARGVNLPVDRSSPPTQPAFVALDGRAYRVGDALVRLQDEAGLYDLNDSQQHGLDKLLQAYGVDDKTRATLLVNLLSYVDLLGTTPSTAPSAADYTLAGLPPARNAPLLTPWELLRVADWRGTDGLWPTKAPISEFTASGRIGALNANTAPPEVLSGVSGMSEQAIHRLIAYRTTHPIGSALDVEQATGLSVAPDELGYLPSNSIRLQITSVTEPLVHNIALRLTPSGPAPFRIDYSVDLPGATIAATPPAAPLPDVPVSSN